jgi:hypothetical protein
MSPMVTLIVMIWARTLGASRRANLGIVYPVPLVPDIGLPKPSMSEIIT